MKPTILLALILAACATPDAQRLHRQGEICAPWMAGVTEIRDDDPLLRRFRGTPAQRKASLTAERGEICD